MHLSSPSSLQVTHFPKASELQECLVQLDGGSRPPASQSVYVALVPVNGGKPPLYVVVLRSEHRERTRQTLSAILQRPLCLGATSFALSVEEAAHLITHVNNLRPILSK